MNRISFVVAFVSLIALGSASAGGTSQRDRDHYFDTMGDDDGTAYLLSEDEMPGETATFAAMESGKMVSSDPEVNAFLDDDPEESDILP